MTFSVRLLALTHEAPARSLEALVPLIEPHGLHRQGFSATGMLERSRLDAMGKPWKCRIGWHEYVRQPGHDDPNDQICLRCHKKRTAASIMPLGGGEGGSGFG